jgi:hypothetical protein
MAGMEEGTRVEFVPFLPGKSEAAGWHTTPDGTRSLRLPLPIPFSLQPKPFGPEEDVRVWRKFYGPLLRDRHGRWARECCRQGRPPACHL